MKKERIILTSLLTALVMTSLQAQQLSAVPKLVVGVTIDQLRSDYMEAFAALYGEKGFKRLLKEGRVYQNVEYSFDNVDRASAMAALYSGTSPYNNGIVGSNWLDRETLRIVNCVDDNKWRGQGTAEFSSPKNLTVSTLPDELKIYTEGKGQVYSIAPYREAAIFSAGHAADAALWLNDLTGKWCSSTYYGNFPTWALYYNEQQGLDRRIRSMSWEPLVPSTYCYIASQGVRSTFKHSMFDKKDYRTFKSSALVNDEVNNMVQACLRGSTLGVDDITDFLAVTYYAGNLEHQTVTECPMEIQDTYARLDKNLADLIDMVDKKVGLKNALFFITSTGYSDAETTKLAKYRIPTGDFSISKCCALLNMYLMATYGQGQYVEAHHGLQIYLNQRLIDKKQLNLLDVMDRAAEFLIQFQGVNEVYTSQHLLLGARTPEINRVKNGYNKLSCGDILLEVNPGWRVVDEDNNNYTQLIRSSFVEFPLIFFGANVKPETLFTPVTVDYVAPTLANFMRIRAPNACKTASLNGLRR